MVRLSLTVNRHGFGSQAAKPDERKAASNSVGRRIRICGHEASGGRLHDSSKSCAAKAILRTAAFAARSVANRSMCRDQWRLETRRERLVLNKAAPDLAVRLCTDIGEATFGEILADEEQTGRKHQASSGELTVSFISNQ